MAITSLRLPIGALLCFSAATVRGNQPTGFQKPGKLRTAITNDLPGFIPLANPEHIQHLLSEHARLIASNLSILPAREQSTALPAPSANITVVPGALHRHDIGSPFPECISPRPAPPI